MRNNTRTHRSYMAHLLVGENADLHNIECYDLCRYRYAPYGSSHQIGGRCHLFSGYFSAKNKMLKLN